MDEVALSARALTVRRGGSTVLEQIDLDARAGEILCVLGPNGAGKSTLLRVLAGLLGYSGEIRLGGTDARQLSIRERARRLAFVPQQSALRSALSVREVVAQGRHMHRGLFAGASAGVADQHEVARALARCDVASLAARAFTELSCGEQRRVLIARALASGARVLCLDEPTAALDVQHVLRLHALLRELADDGYAVIAVLHPLDDALRHTDRALMLADGRAIACGPSSRVIENAHVRKVYGVEMREDSALGFRLAEELV